MSYDFVADIVFTLLHGKRPLCVVETRWGHLGATYIVHLIKLIGKLLVDL